jgi:hypothetical protein
MAECGKEFGEDFTKTLFGSHFNLAYFDKTVNNAFSQ